MRGYWARHGIDVASLDLPHDPPPSDVTSGRCSIPEDRARDAIAAAVELKPKGVNAIFTKLGENITQLSEAEDVYQHYLKVLDLIKKAGIDGEISIKPTQLGYDQDVEKCFDYCMKILKA